VRHDGAVNGELPDYVTHYYVPGRAPFLNLSELTNPEWDAMRKVLEAERATGSSSRVFGRRYLELRRATEARLRDLFVAAGGTPERAVPHYFVLGSSTWFQGLATKCKRSLFLFLNFPNAPPA
jgi:hypothetical protein